MFVLGASVLAAAGLSNFLKGSIDEAREAQKVGAQTGAVLKSTGGIANVSSKQIEKLAGALSAKIGVDDEAIQSGENLLLTFTNVRNEVGKGNDIFTQATRTVQDMAAAFGGDAVSNSKILGRALNDPIKGVSALTRVGVSFTEKQKEQIKTLVESGDTMKAQKIILGELAKETEGSAEAQVTAADKASVALGNLKEQVGTALLPVLDRLANFFTDKAAPAVSKFVDEVETGTGKGGEFRDVAEQLGGTIRDVAKFFIGLPDSVKRFGAEAGIAALILPRLKGAIDGITQSVGLSTGKLTGFRKGLVLAAGVGGLVALTEGARTGNKQVSLLGGALTGAFVGGTLGSAIPGVGTAIGAVAGFAGGAAVQMVRMQRAADKAGDSAESASPKIDGLAESLNQTSGAATRATKALILQKLQEDGIVTSAGQLGIATSDLIKSVLGNKKAIDRVNTAWEKNGNLLDGLTNQKVSSWLTTLRGGLSKSEKSIKDANAALDGTDRKAKKAADALIGVGKSPPATNKWQALYSGDLDKATTNTGKFTTITQRRFGEVRVSVDRLSKSVRDIPSHKDVKINVVTVFSHQGRPPSQSGDQQDLDLGPSTRQQLKDLGTIAERGAKDVGDGIAKGLLYSQGIAGAAVDKLSAKVKEKLGNLRDTLAGVKADFASLAEPISSNFTQGLFDFETAGAFTANLTTVKGTLTTLLDNFKKLIGEGLRPGFLYQLFASGGPGLINSLAGLDAASAQAAGGLFGDVMDLSSQLGTAVAGATDKGAGLEKQTVRLEKKLDHLIKAVHNSADRTGDVVNGAAAAGHRRGQHGGRRAA